MEYLLHKVWFTERHFCKCSEILLILSFETSFLYKSHTFKIGWPQHISKLLYCINWYWNKNVWHHFFSAHYVTMVTDVKFVTKMTDLRSNFVKTMFYTICYNLLLQTWPRLLILFKLSLTTLRIDVFYILDYFLKQSK